MKVAQPFSKSIWQMEDKLIHSIVKLLINPFGLKYVSITKGKSYVRDHLNNDFPGFIVWIYKGKEPGEKSQLKITLRPISSKLLLCM